MFSLFTSHHQKLKHQKQILGGFFFSVLSQQLPKEVNSFKNLFFFLIIPFLLFFFCIVHRKTDGLVTLKAKNRHKRKDKYNSAHASCIEKHQETYKYSDMKIRNGLEFVLFLFSSIFFFFHGYLGKSRLAGYLLKPTIVINNNLYKLKHYLELLSIQCFCDKNCVQFIALST